MNINKGFTTLNITTPKQLIDVLKELKEKQLVIVYDQLFTGKQVGLNTYEVMTELCQFDLMMSKDIVGEAVQMISKGGDNKYKIIVGKDITKGTVYKLVPTEKAFKLVVDRELVEEGSIEKVEQSVGELKELMNKDNKQQQQEEVSISKEETTMTTSTIKVEKKVNRIYAVTAKDTNQVFDFIVNSLKGEDVKKRSVVAMYNTEGTVRMAFLKKKQQSELLSPELTESLFTMFADLKDYKESGMIKLTEEGELFYIVTGVADKDLYKELKGNKVEAPQDKQQPKEEKGESNMNNNNGGSVMIKPAALKQYMDQGMKPADIKALLDAGLIPQEFLMTPAAIEERPVEEKMGNEELLNNMADIMEGDIKPAADMISKLPDSMKKEKLEFDDAVVEGNTSKIKAAGMAALSKFKSSLDDKQDKKKVGNIIDMFLAGINKVVSFTATHGKVVWDFIINGIKYLWGFAVGVITSLFQITADILTGIWNAVQYVGGVAAATLEHNVSNKVSAQYEQYQQRMAMSQLRQAA